MPEQSKRPESSDSGAPAGVAYQPGPAATTGPPTDVQAPGPDEREFINAFILNENNEVLILERPAPEKNRGVDWRVLHGWLQTQEDPLTAGRRWLQLLTGHQTDNWFYLGSYSGLPMPPDVIGHIFFARDARPLPAPPGIEHDYTVRWLPLQQVRYGLIDGRINKSSCALTVSLTLLTLKNMTG